ncbi:ABC transporter substrate-binding protein [Melaminivora alkalimesophila]|uniref:Amino acid/amide ABC transporter substrate-binding protein (HAAT family) n=1 Tax=Melaminivora alkalimesophila TaxID=1165852 RepID=A0A317REU3_9BURK|nr:ABC transporter substrate-binding protein [Melaminivora alkalimesophila]PWW46976.1 amino acid/amide ABC transporter substrate-binding protein (HAAT family) [Melaminivora alkalimesophila]
MRATAWRKAAAALVVAALAAVAQAQPIKVGVIGPFSGPSSDFGKPMLQGIQLAVEQFNQVGGYLGRPVELVIKDDEAVPDVGRKRSEELAAEGVVAALGFCNTGVAMPSLEVYQKAQLPLIVPCATGTPITRAYPPEQSYIFRTSAPDSIQAPFVVADIVRRGWTRVAIFADDTGYGQAGRKDVEAALAAHKLAPVYTVNFPLGAKNLTAELAAARDAGAQVIFSYTVGPENAVIGLGRKELGWKVPMVGGWPLSFPFFLEGAKDAAEGAMMAQTFIAEPSNERRASFLSNYSRAYQGRPAVPVAAAQGYDAAYLLMYALLGIRDGKFTGPAVKRSLENLPRVYYGVVATYERPFSEQEKDAMTPSMLVMGKVQSGAVTFAYPEDARRTLMVQRKR